MHSSNRFPVWKFDRLVHVKPQIIVDEVNSKILKGSKGKVLCDATFKKAIATDNSKSSRLEDKKVWLTKQTQLALVYV